MSLDELEQHKANVRRLEEELSAARALLHAGLLEHSPFAIGDLVKMTTAMVALDLETARNCEPVTIPMPDKVEYGRVRGLRVVKDELRYQIAPKVKDNPVQTVRMYSHDRYTRIEKVEVIP